MNSVLVFGGDWAEIIEDYHGASVYECSMVVPLKEVSKELEEKIKLFNDTHEEEVSQQELVKYCIDKGLVMDENIEQKLKEFYDLK